MKNVKKKQFQIKLNEIRQTDDPTVLPCTFIILDFDVSRNNAVISKDLALEIAPTVLNKPIVAKYYSPDQPNTSTDALGDHQVSIGEDRYGELELKLNTTPIGVFTTEGYVMDYMTPNGDTIEVLAADAVLWKSRFNDACDLISEWYQNSVNINTSCEILYQNFSFRDGIEYMESPAWMEGHCVLNSEQRGDHNVVLPAYENSKLLSINQIEQFQRLVAQAINQGNEEGGKMEKFRKVFELSHSDVRSLLYKAFDETLGESEYSWISDVYDNYFVVNVYNDDYSSDKYFKVNYTKDGDSVVVDSASKVEVFLKRDWVEVSTQELETQLNEYKGEAEQLKTKVSEFETQLNEVKTEKESIETKFNNASETIIQLNSQIEELKPIQEKYNQEQFEKALNEKKDYYSAKFEAVKAVDKFESEEVQTLLNQAVKDDEDGKEAILQLNTMLVELVTKEVENNEKPAIRELSSKRENLLPPTDDFESRYK